MARVGNPMAAWWRRHQAWCHGRIVEHASSWVLIGPATPPSIRSANGIAFADRADADGRRMRLVHQAGVHCGNPLVGGEGPYPRMRTEASEEPLYFVPASVCRHCPWRWPRGKHGLGYPHCGWALKVRGGQERAMRDLRAGQREVGHQGFDLPGRGRAYT